MPRPRLADCSLFFGETPESSGFLVFRRSDGATECAAAARALIARAAGLAAARGLESRAATGMLLAGAGGPRHLRSLPLHGDGDEVADHSERTYGALFFAGRADPLAAFADEAEAMLRSAEPGIAVESHRSCVNRGGIGHGGFVDPVSNLQELAPAQFDACVFVGAEDRAHAGGSYLVVRDYVEDVEMWHDLPVEVQEQIVGRTRHDNRLIGGGLLWNGAPNAVAERAHVACVRPGRERKRFQWRDRLYRRSLPFVDCRDGRLEYGLHFIVLCRNPVAQLKRIHDRHVFRRGSRFDRLISSGYVHPRSTTLLFLPAH
jgi:putative iron-dependent peroxidase